MNQPFDAIILAPNSAIDSYYELDQLLLGSVNIARRAFHMAGGKGNNLARALKLLGGSPFCLGLAGGESGRFIDAELTRENIPHDFTWTSEETRRCNTIFIEGVKDTTVILEKGAELDPKLADSLADACVRHAKNAPFLIITGSLPRGFPKDFYARLVSLLKSSATKVCIDTSGDALKLASQFGPAIIKINKKEFEDSLLAPGECFTLDTGQTAFKNLQKKGLETLIITDGSNGSFIFQSPGTLYSVRTQLPDWVSSAGAGDTFLAAMVFRLNRGDDPEAVFAYASAAAAANMRELGCGILNPSDIPELLSLTSTQVLAHI